MQGQNHLKCIILTFILILSFHLHKGNSNGLLPVTTLSNNMLTRLVIKLRATCLHHLIFPEVYHKNYIC